MPPSGLPVVTNRHDAGRVAQVGDLFADVLLELDPRVRAVYAAWCTRMVAYETAGDWSDATVTRAIAEDATELTTLAQRLGLRQQYPWLAIALRRAFQRSIEGDPMAWTLAVPEGLPWEEKGRAPKAGPKQREDLRRNVEWFYRAHVKQPPDTVYQLGKEYAAENPLAKKNSQHGTVQYGIARAKELLACINAGDRLVVSNQTGGSV